MSKRIAAPRRRVAALASAASLVCAATNWAACVDPDAGGVPDSFEPESNTSSTGTSGTLTYPVGPYGVTRGQIIQNYAFAGFPRPDVDDGSFVSMQLGDFYNPTGDGVFDEGSPYGSGAPKPRAVGIVVGAVWCGPCQQEARSVLPEKHERLAPLGGQLFFVLADSNEPGVPASKSDLVNWTRTFDNDYPSVLDPEYALGAVIRADSFPANILIDTRDMSIVDVVSGVPPESYWVAFETLAKSGE